MKTKQEKSLIEQFDGYPLCSKIMPLWKKQRGHKLCTQSPDVCDYCMKLYKTRKAKG